MTNITVCLIVRNEETNILRSLKSIPKKFEIVVGDTGSTDRTKEIALSMKAKVVDIVWQDNFAQARNETAALATGSYILFIDADEELQPGSETVIRNFIRKHPNEAGAVTIKNMIGNEIHMHQMARFYPNNGQYRYSGFVHETVYHGDAPANCYRTELMVTHHGYQPEEYEVKNKAARYFRLYEQHLAQQPQDGYMLYQLGKLHFSLKNYEEAIQVLKQCLQLGEEQQLYFPVMVVMLGYGIKELGQSEEAECLLTPYAAKYPGFPDMPFLLGLLAMDTGKIRDVEHYFLLALSIGDSDTYTSVYGVGSFKAAFNLGIFYEITGQLDSAVKYYREAAKSQYQPAKERLQLLRKRIKF